MPHRPNSKGLVGPTTTYVYPRATGAGGTSHEGCAGYDGKGQALWAQFYPGDANNLAALNIYRTRNGPESLLTTSDSVDYLSTVVNGTFQNGCVYLQRIDGKLYCIVTAKNMGTNEHGTIIYRDGSNDQDGSGPWVRHGSVYVENWASTGTQNDGRGGGEIIVLPNGRWVCTAMAFGVWSGSTARALGLVATSDDGGSTWTTRLGPMGWYIQSVYMYGWARNMAMFGGHIYVGGYGNVNAARMYKSADGITWTYVGNMARGNSAGSEFIFSNETRAWRLTSGFGGGQIQYTDTLPDGDVETMWTTAMGWSLPNVSSDGNFPAMSNAGPDAKPLWALTRGGAVCSLKELFIGGWTVGRIGVGG